jgi:hypothetical protein
MSLSKTAALFTLVTALVSGTVGASPLLKARAERNANGCYEMLQTPLGWGVSTESESPIFLSGGFRP